jgi:hypothetical protein
LRLRRQRAERRRGSAGFALLLEERLNEPRDQVLLATRERNGLLEDALELADRPGPALLDGLIAEDVFDTDAKSFGELGQDVGARRQVGCFPEADGFGRDADELGELGLAEASGFTERDETSGLLGSRLGETPRHAGSVRVHLRILWNWGRKLLLDSWYAR